ncbi:thiamine pyrophosphokinase-related protein [Aspergillus saccharolyticus JOP 1030-1]|uniref:Thiamine pyrophosphokinase-related protein n=1 Tax=Aspergillus saccharolyticus JOP 1030-1 TaxID=1450539 RepID=A0A318Z8X0_9EURO|nr:thiamine pyrophosphokinase-related protein [Aspergillus saccharolyticus JOP 1030-1]PYH42827.1 thiamine pyrophosphokinase-related protein [Aspergillus saccharolyticus JOP 1030-1]
MGKSNLDLVKECDRFPYHQDDPAFYASHLQNYHALKVTGCDAVLGYILNSVVHKFPWPQGHWAIDAANRTVTLVTGPDATPAQRSAQVAQTLAEAVRQDTFQLLRGWRNEMYPVYGPGGEFLFEMERSATPLFGVVSYGVHATCYVDDGHSTGGGLRLWIPRRSRTKQTYPGMLDNSVAGGMSSHEKPFECLVREASEEASLPEEVTRANARAAGCVTYFYVRGANAGGETDLLQPEVEYIYDVKLGADVVLKPCDTEVEEFHLLSVEETQQALANGEFKPNCAVVLIDFFIRHGILTAENEPDFLEIQARIHRRLEFPTASHAMI